MALVEIKKVLRIVTSHGLGTPTDPCRHVTAYVDADTLKVLDTYDPDDSNSKLEMPSE